MHTLRSASAAATAALISCALVACGSSGSGSSTSPPGGGASSQLPSGSSSPSGTPINLGYITTVQSQDFSFPQFPIAAKLAATAINASGGVNGHPIEIDFCDDQNTASVAASCAQKLVEQDHIVALVGSESVQGASIYPFLTQGGVANFGEYPASAPDFTNPLSFPIVPGALELSGLAQIMPPGTKRAVLVYTQAGAIAWTFFQAGCKELGVTPIGIQTSGAASSADYDPIIAEITKAKPDVVATTDTAGMPQFLSAMNAEGPNVPIELFSAGITSAVLNASKGVKQPITSTLGLSYTGATRDEFLSEAQKYGAGLNFTDTDSLGAINAWLAVNVFATIAKGLPTVDAASFLAAVRRQSSVVTGMTLPLNFTANGPSKAFPRIVNTHIYEGEIMDGKVEQESTKAISLV